MASQFVGHIVIVDLVQPPGQQVRGQVKDVIVGQALTLSKGMPEIRSTAGGIEMLIRP